VDWSVEGDVRLIVKLIAEADAVLATGHLSEAEVGWLLPVASELGVRRMLLTHPSYTVPAMHPKRVAELTELGAYAEITAFQLWHQPGCDSRQLADLVRTVGYERIVLSSDAGQPDSPAPPDALRHLVEALVVEGLDADALRASASEIPEILVSPEPLR